MVVQKDNTIYINSTQLGGSGHKKVTVHWSQNHKDRSAEYYVCKFQNRSDSNAEGVCFVQRNYADELKGRAVGTDEYKVTDVFQYGQKKDGTGRFVVYHDRNSRPFQHRFIDSTVTTLGREAATVLVGMAITRVDDLRDLTSSFAGEFIRSF